MISKTALYACMMPELYMARTCKWGVLRVVGGDVWDHNGDALVTPANNRLSGREGLDAQIHALKLVANLLKLPATFAWRRGK